MTAQTLLTIFYLAWLILVLALLFAIWRSSARNATSMIQPLIDVALKSADAAQKAVEAVYLILSQRGKDKEKE